MTLEQIFALHGNDWDKIIAEIQKEAKDTDEYVDEYAGERKQRDGQVGKREKKTLTDGGQVDVNKIPIPFQKHIVRFAASFMFGKPVKITTTEESLDLAPLLDYWKDKRLDALMLKFCETAKAYTQAAILFQKNEEGFIKPRLLSPKHGTLVALWAEFDQLDAFAYITEADIAGKKTTITYIWTETSYWKILQGDSTVVESSGTHGFDRMPIVYHEEEAVEYEDVKSLIDRFENRFSRFADTNDYFASPFFKAVGKVTNVPQKDDTGSVFMMDVIETDKGSLLTSDLDVVAWDQNVEATDVELKTGKDLIYELTNTPNLSFENVKGLSNLSGIALKMMFLSSSAKANFSFSDYCVAVRRAINVMMGGGPKVEGLNAQAFLEARLDIRLNSIIPTNDEELVRMLSESTFNKPIMSQETALSHHPYIDDATAEKGKLDSEATDQLGGSENL